jgi:ABC-2 type transport system permease protein
VLGALVGISGIVYPLAALPGWLQGVAQVFPMYWLGHGMRAALLPDAAAAAELGGDWRLWQAAAILGAWTWPACWSRPRCYGGCPPRGY